jgi:virginiamycin A acetyltransferase
MIEINATMKQRLLDLGVSTLHGVPFALPSDCTFEPPCSIKWMSIQHSLLLGAFSYAVSGYYFATSIGRYTSIGEDVQIGRGSHPVSWASSSPLFYQRHREVFDFEWAPAAEFQVDAPYIEPVQTTIGNDVYIGHGAIIMQGVEIGDGAVIGAGSVVTKNVAPYAVVAGSPAVVRKMRFDEDIVARMIAMSWWQYAFWDLAGVPITSPREFLDFVDHRKAIGIEPYRPDVISLRSLASPDS